MIKPELVDYVKKSKELGKSINDIRLDLANAGWSPLDIEHSLEFVNDASRRAQVAMRMMDSDKTLGVGLSQNSIKRSVIISASFLGVIGLVLTGLIYFEGKNINSLLSKARSKISETQISKFFSLENDYRNFKSDSLGFSINYPNDWVVASSTDEQYSSYYTFASSEKAKELPIPDKQSVVYVELSYGKLEQIKQMLSDKKKLYTEYGKESGEKLEFNYTEPQKVKLGSLDAYKFEYDLNSNKRNSEIVTGHTVQYLLSNPHVPYTYYKISLNTDTKSIESEKKFEKMVSSFEIRDTIRWQKYTDKDGIFSMDYPPLWKTEHFENDPNGMIAAFLSPEDYTGLRNIIISVTVITSPDLNIKYSSIPLSYFANSILKKTSMRPKVIGKPSLSDVVFGSYKAKMISSSTKSDNGIPFLLEQIIFLSGERLMLISIAKNPDNIDFDTDLEKMFKSFSM